MSGKRVIDEDYVPGASLQGTEAVRISRAPYNTPSTNGYTLMSDIAAWFTAQFGSNNVPAGFQANITAFATGGQTSATQLTKRNNNFGVVASDGDSAKLLAGLPGMVMKVFCPSNMAGNPSIFPAVGEVINGITNFEFHLVKGNLVIFECVAAGQWISFNSTI